ncbi:YceI family protein [Chitinophagaceae bacterium LWZ2-11]
MKRTFFILLFLGLVSYLQAQDFTFSDEGSTVTFSVKNLGINVNGKLTGLKGKGYFDPANLKESHLEATVDSKTVNTNNSGRDGHLQKKDYLDADAHPLIELHSATITSSGENQFVFDGIVTIKGKSKNISFPFTAVQENGSYVFTGNFTIKRKDFDISGGMTMSDEIKVSIKAAGKKI